MADPRSAEAAWAAALAAWQSVYVKEAAPLGGMLADEVSVPLDPFPSEGHKPCLRASALASLRRRDVSWCADTSWLCGMRPV